ncbi:IK [Cordylochernes scorpioides]|uniref:IK n=1 Tax=Cordylochernes scorpioides TaxID=51811 RepID=A0ABY6JZH3_9ARAC|nr:IK [Cordylochernes scorpioides]
MLLILYPWRPYRVLSTWPAESRFISELVTAPPPPFSSGLGTGKGGVKPVKIREPVWLQAKERREGNNTDYQHEDFISSTAGYKAVAPDIKSNMDAAERRRRMIQESKFLGGDMEHTHLVKGLDYALLKKVKVRHSVESSFFDNHQESSFFLIWTTIRNLLSFLSGQPSGIFFLSYLDNHQESSFFLIWTSIRNLLSYLDNHQESSFLSGQPSGIFFLSYLDNHQESSFFLIWITSGIFYDNPNCDDLSLVVFRSNEAPEKKDLFLPGRMAYVIDLDDEFAESDIPTTLLRSKADYPAIEKTRSFCEISSTWQLNRFGDKDPFITKGRIQDVL